VKLPIHMRLSAYAARLCEWEQVNEKAHHFSQTRGMSKILQVPGLLSGILRAASGGTSTQSYLVREGWRNGGWASILSKWLDEQLLSADPAITKPTILRENDRITSVVYSGVGIYLRRLSTRGVVTSVLTAPNEDAINWVSTLMDKSGGGVIRLLPPKLRKRSNSDSPYGPDEEEESETNVWSLEHNPWPDMSEEWVEGDWAPTCGEVSKALFPNSKGVGRSLLLIGPPGVGKTETAIRACLMKHGKNSRVLVVHGSVFARGSNGMSGRDAVSLVKAFKACALVVDDMPPSSTVALLEEFEALHREHVAVAITLMTDGNLPRLPGLRPGRIDEVMEFRPPSIQGRLTLLRAAGYHPSWEEMSSDPRMEDMTPAYLKELSYRIMSGVDPEKVMISLAMQKKIAT